MVVTFNFFEHSMFFISTLTCTVAKPSTVDRSGKRRRAALRNCSRTSSLHCLSKTNPPSWDLPPRVRPLPKVTDLRSCPSCRSPNKVAETWRVKKGYRQKAVVVHSLLCGKLRIEPINVMTYPY